MSFIPNKITAIDLIRCVMGGTLLWLVSFGISIQANTASTTVTLDVSALVLQPITLAISKENITPSEVLIFTVGPVRNSSNTILVDIICRISFTPPQLGRTIILETKTNADGLCIYRTDQGTNSQNWTIIQGAVADLTYINTPEGAGTAVASVTYPNTTSLSNNVNWLVDDEIEGVSGVVINPNPDGGSPNVTPIDNGNGGSIVSGPSTAGGGNNLTITPRTGGNVLIGVFAGLGIGFMFFVGILTKKSKMDEDEVIQPTRVE